MQRSRRCIYPDLGHEDIPCKSNVMETKACTLNECRGTNKERNTTSFYNPFVNITEFWNSLYACVTIDGKYTL